MDMKVKKSRKGGITDSALLKKAEICPQGIVCPVFRAKRGKNHDFSSQNA